MIWIFTSKQTVLKYNNKTIRFLCVTLLYNNQNVSLAEIQITLYFGRITVDIVNSIIVKIILKNHVTCCSNNIRFSHNFLGENNEKHLCRRQFVFRSVHSRGMPVVIWETIYLYFQKINYIGIIIIRLSDYVGVSNFDGNKLIASCAFLNLARTCVFECL